MDNLVNIFQSLVKIDSPTGSEGELADFLVNYFSDRNLKAEKDIAGNVFVRIAGKGEPLLISAHMDTVEPGRGIVPEVINGEVRSSSNTILGADNKTAIAVILEVVERLKNKTHRPLEILFTVGEEIGSPGVKNFDYTQLKSKKGLIADVSWPIGSIVLASPTYMRYDIQFIGESGHAAYPEKAKSIVRAVGELLSQSKAGKLDDDTILNIAIVNFGSVRNAIPGYGDVKGEIRSFSDTLLEKHSNLFFENAKKIAGKYDLEIKILTHVENESYVFEEKDKYVQEIAKIIKSEGITPTFVKNWSCSDANIFNSKNLQVVNIADGTKNTHTINESIKITDMEKLVNIFLKCCTI
ncbi:MAG TPA: M20/M25/M40 family metallo-hydrolase [Candidatus Saccharimonadales bacterium]|nr:M20/M25/M40 family metallo-hydrolase [Candidatus Saccharimonadales bacterium]